MPRCDLCYHMEVLAHPLAHWWAVLFSSSFGWSWVPKGGCVSSQDVAKVVEGTASSAELSRVITALENNKLTEQDRKAIAEKAAKNTEVCEFLCACVTWL